MELNPLKIGHFILKHPIIQGGMGVGISGWRLASAVSNAGGLGVISAAQNGYREEDFWKSTTKANIRAFKAEISKARQATSGPIGVNIMVAMCNYVDLVKTAVEEKVDLIIAGAGLPVDLPELVKGSVTKIAPVVSSLRATQLIVRRWVKKYDRLPDAIIVEGPLAGGHLGFKREDLLEDKSQDIYTIVEEISQYMEKNEWSVPIIAAGGIFYGKDIIKAIKAGACGVQMATRFVATNECDASEEFKQAYVDVKEEDIVLMQSPVGMPGRAMKNPFLEDVWEKGNRRVKRCTNCVKKCDPRSTPFCITEALINAVKGDLDHALVFMGARAYEIKKMQTVREIFDELQQEIALA